jgi:hypothetical protein
MNKKDNPTKQLENITLTGEFEIEIEAGMRNPVMLLITDVIHHLSLSSSVTWKSKPTKE